MKLWNYYEGKQTKLNYSRVDIEEYDIHPKWPETIQFQIH